MTLQAASQLSLPPTPHSLVTPHTATTKSRPPLPGTPHPPLCRERTSDLSTATPARSVLLVAAICYFSFVPVATNQPAVCISPRYLVFHSFITSFMMTSWPLLQARISYSARPLTADNRWCGAKGRRSRRLRFRQALPVSRYACAHYCM